MLLRSARNDDIAPGAPGFLDTSAAIPPLEVPTGRVDRSMGDVHPYGNPHYLTDPLNGLRVARLIREKPPRRPSTMNRTLKGDVETIVLKALEKDRDDRYQAVADLAEDLRRFLKDNYSANRMVLSAAGKVDHDQLVLVFLLGFLFQVNEEGFPAALRP